MKSGLHKRRTTILAVTALALGFCSFLLQAENKPSITSAVPVYSTNPHALMIFGTGLGSSQPVVTISGIPAQVLSYTELIVTVQIPKLIDAIPGTYTLELATGFGNGANQTQLDITLGSGGGESGTQGPAGPTGPQGPAGAAGAKGATGATGAAGAAGATGAMGATGSQGPAGPTGSQGPAGPAGSQGATGQQGPAGAQGQQGTPGAAGLNGVNGTPGATGATGAQGPPGPGGGAVQMVTVTIHRADMIALNTTAITLVPAVPNAVIMPVRILVQQNNAVYMSGSEELYFAYGTIASPVSTNSSGMLWGSGDAKYLDDAAFNLFTNADASALANQPYIVFTPDQVGENGGTGGDVTFTVLYSVMPVQ